jgi:hypothetical protein
MMLSAASVEMTFVFLRGVSSVTRQGATARRVEVYIPTHRKVRDEWGTRSSVS